MKAAGTVRCFITLPPFPARHLVIGRLGKRPTRRFYNHLTVCSRKNISRSFRLQEKVVNKVTTEKQTRKSLRDASWKIPSFCIEPTRMAVQNPICPSPLTLSIWVMDGTEGAGVDAVCIITCMEELAAKITHYGALGHYNHDIKKSKARIDGSCSNSHQWCQ